MDGFASCMTYYSIYLDAKTLKCAPQQRQRQKNVMRPPRVYSKCVHTAYLPTHNDISFLCSLRVIALVPIARNVEPIENLTAAARVCALWERVYT